jgi:hypothetical protein
MDQEEREEMLDYAEYYGIDAASEPHLLWIAREGMHAPLPEGWQEVVDDSGTPYYFELETRRTQVIRRKTRTPAINCREVGLYLMVAVGGAVVPPVRETP